MQTLNIYMQFQPLNQVLILFNSATCKNEGMTPNQY